MRGRWKKEGRRRKEEGNTQLLSAAFYPPSSLFHPPSSFTLIELVFVMAVLGILLVAVAPRVVQTTERLHVERSAFELTQLLRYAHEVAVSEAREVVWAWDQGAHRARLELVQDDGSTKPIGERMSMSSRLSDDIAVVLLREGASVTRVSFLPDGTSQPTTLRVTHDKNSYTATIDEATSQVLLSTWPAPR